MELNDFNLKGNDEKKRKLQDYTNRFIYKGNNEWNDLFKNLKLDSTKIKNTFN